MGVGVAAHALGVNQAESDQAINRLDHVNAVAAGNRNARLAANRRAAFEHAANHFEGQLGNRHAHQRQRQNRCAAHRVNIRQRIGRGNAAKVIRVIDDGGEKIGGRHQRLGFVQAVNGGVVGGFGADQQLGRDDALGRACQNLAQQAGRNFAAASTAVGELGEANGLCIGIDSGGSSSSGHSGGDCASHALAPAPSLTQSPHWTTFS